MPEIAKKVEELGLALVDFLADEAKKRNMHLHEAVIASDVAYALISATTCSNDAEKARRYHDHVWGMMMAAPLELQNVVIDKLNELPIKQDATPPV